MKKIRLFFTLMMVLCTSSAYAQLRTVIGTATDEAGIALPGVSVVVKGTTSGAVTDKSGAYAIEAPADATLVFSSLGYKTEQIEIGTRSIVNCILEEDTQYLEEVVVTAVGIQRSDRSLGYSVTKVSSEEAIQKAEPDYEKAARKRKDVMSCFVYQDVVVSLVRHSSSSIESLYRMVSDCFSSRNAVHSDAETDNE